MHRLLPLSALALLSGCTDSLGIGANCDSEMRRVQLEHGQPDQVQVGVRSAQWIYNDRTGRFYINFDWSTGACTVSDPISFRRDAAAPRAGG